MFCYRRCNRTKDISDKDGSDPFSAFGNDDEKMGFIMFEAGLESIALR